MDGAGADEIEPWMPPIMIGEHNWAKLDEDGQGKLERAARSIGYDGVYVLPAYSPYGWEPTKPADVALANVNERLKGKPVTDQPDEDPDEAMAAALSAGPSQRGKRFACPAKHCYLELGHDDFVHGLRMPPMSSRRARRGNRQGPKARRR